MKINLSTHKKFMKVAMAQAQKGLKEGGIPIGSCLVINGRVVGKGHNRRVQSGNPILHGEMDCLQNAGRLKAKDYQKAVIYTTLSPCEMCSGAIRLYKIPVVIMAENTTYKGDEVTLKKSGVTLINLKLPEAIKMMRTFIKKYPELWNEDIGTD